MSTTTATVLAAIAAGLLLASAASGASLKHRLYDWYLERGLAKRSGELQLTCGSESETLAYFDSGPPRRGTGEPILLLHGFTGDKRSWRGMVGRLAKHHRLVAPDLAGHGKSSDAADGDYTFKPQAERARQLVKSLAPKIDGYHVLGHSMGGAVAIELASLYPAEVLSVGLIAAAGAKDQHTDTVMNYLHGKTRPGVELNPLIVSEAWRGGERLRFVTNEPWLLKLVAWAFDDVMTDEALPRKNLYLRIFDDIKELETKDPLICDDLKPARPTFYLYGAEDRVLRPYWASCFSSSSPDSWVLERVPGVGHSPNVEWAKGTARAYLKFLHGRASGE